MLHDVKFNAAISNPSGYLTDRLLVAMPSVQDGCFDRSVVYICSHNPEGAMGIIINSPIQSILLEEVLEQLSIPVTPQSRPLAVQFGGPVEAHRGFLLHSAESALEDSVVQASGVALTANIQILREVAQGHGPQEGFLVLGYAGWSPGQLESEIEAGSWIVAAADKRIIFDTENEHKWSLAAASLGIADSSRLSYTVGHA